MKEQQGSNRISSGVIAAISAAVVAVSGGVAWLTWNSTHSPVSVTPEQSTPIQSSPPQPSTTNPPTNHQQTAEIYLLKDTGKNFQLVPQPVKVQVDGDRPNQVLEAAFQTLLAEPTEATNSSTIPKGTKLLGLKVENDGIHVNLSENFTTGGGSSSMTGRVGQVVYTATSLDHSAKVYIEINGKQLDTLGGEGLELEQPLTRDSFQKNYQL
ncbi:MAG: GerMN domain-containing protein [Stigonema ocellatum SAG 48.90 = DSM 106950]|nr:GerMN domain-containing protein [Stigonema ocellatum SAG 48.90 = DSM 106950]